MSSNDRLISTPTSDIKPERKRWALESRVPLRAITILAGEPKQGKSTWGLDLAAALSRGTAKGDLEGEPAASEILSFEDDFAATVVPRLLAAGADLSRIHLLNPLAASADGSGRIVSLAAHFEQLADLCERVEARLLILDPLMAAFASGTDSHRDQDVRRALAPLAQLADRLDMAALVIAHTNKGRHGDLIRRIGASVGLSGAARSLLVLGPDPRNKKGSDGPGRVLASRGNLAAPVPALAYELQPVTVEHDGEQFDTSKLALTGEVEVEPSELLAPVENRKGVERARAFQFLQDYLADGEWHDSRPLKEEAKAEGIKERTLKRAKHDLGIDDRSQDFPATTQWRLAGGSGEPGPTGGGPTGRRDANCVPEPNEATTKPQSGHMPPSGPTGDAEA